jgi:histidinol-phosphate aminotransferase
LIRHVDGVVQLLSPTFSEYARGARLAGRTLLSARSPAAFLRAQRAHRGIGFVCWPNNPTGDAWPADFIAAAAETGPVVVDLAYAALCDLPGTDALEVAAHRAYRLYSPNKAFGLTGVRGAYLITPRADRDLANAAPSWVIGRDAVALLDGSTQAPAREWLARCMPRIGQWRSRFASSLRKLGLVVRESPSTFLLVNVGNATRAASRLRTAGVRVRDCSSFGLRQWIRVSAQPPRAQRVLLETLQGLL